jgi:hypothetical protein
VGRDYPQVELKNMADRSSEVLSTEVLFDQLAGLLGD